MSHFAHFVTAASGNNTLLVSSISGPSHQPPRKSARPCVQRHQAENTNISSWLYRPRKKKPENFLNIPYEGQQTLTKHAQTHAPGISWQCVSYHVFPMVGLRCLSSRFIFFRILLRKQMHPPRTRQRLTRSPPGSGHALVYPHSHFSPDSFYLSPVTISAPRWQVLD